MVAEIDGRIVGSNFLDERSPIRGVGPITVAPEGQNSGVGRKLMQAVLERGEELPVAFSKTHSTCARSPSMSRLAST